MIAWPGWKIKWHNQRVQRAPAAPMIRNVRSTASSVTYPRSHRLESPPERISEGVSMMYTAGGAGDGTDIEAVTLCHLSEYRPERCPHDIRYIPGRLSSTSNRGLRHCVPRQRQVSLVGNPNEAWPTCPINPSENMTCNAAEFRDHTEWEV
jgi:hypothetical protein